MTAIAQVEPTALERWLTDAKAGGLELPSGSFYPQVYLLEPKAWKAVGKTRGWRERSEGTFEAEMECWQAYWDTFFADLREQVTIEEALKSLETN